MDKVTISDAVKYIGVDDTDLDLFEGQYHCAERGILQLLCRFWMRRSASYGYRRSEKNPEEWLEKVEKLRWDGRTAGLPG